MHIWISVFLPCLRMVALFFLPCYHRPSCAWELQVAPNHSPFMVGNANTASSWTPAYQLARKYIQHFIFHVSSYVPTVCFPMVFLNFIPFFPMRPEIHRTMYLQLLKKKQKSSLIPSFFHQNPWVSPIFPWKKTAPGRRVHHQRWDLL